ncbi:MAG: type II toxin-antitoxin system prevent-host-death family antitoxin [Phycisphaerales bacterium]
MGKIPMIIPVTDLRQDAAAALEQVRESGEPIVITQRGRAAAVMLSVEAYERLEAERELLIRFVRGELESAVERGADPEAVLAEIDRLVHELDAADLTPAQRQDLRERIAEYRANPDRGSTWEEVKARLLSR